MRQQVSCYPVNVMTFPRKKRLENKRIKVHVGGRRTCVQKKTQVNNFPRGAGHFLSRVGPFQVNFRFQANG